MVSLSRHANIECSTHLCLYQVVKRRYKYFECGNTGHCQFVLSVHDMAGPSLPLCVCVPAGL
jgi:hypothetical protein